MFTWTMTHFHVLTLERGGEVALALKKVDAVLDGEQASRVTTTLVTVSPTSALRTVSADLRL